MSVFLLLCVSSFPSSFPVGLSFPCFFCFPQGNTCFSPLQRQYSHPHTRFLACALASTCKHPVLAANCSAVSPRSGVGELGVGVPAPSMLIKWLSPHPQPRPPPSVPLTAGSSHRLWESELKAREPEMPRPALSLPRSLGAEILQPQPQSHVVMCVRVHMYLCKDMCTCVHACVHVCKPSVITSSRG